MAAAELCPPPDELPAGGGAKATNPLKQFTCIIRKTVGHLRIPPVKSKIYHGLRGAKPKAIDKVGADAANLRPPGEGLGFEWM
jgi:hypothetical protein